MERGGGELDDTVNLWIKDEKECLALLSRNIKRFRSRLGLSQIELAFALNISTPFLSNIETGKAWVSSKTLTLLAKALKVEVYQLFKPDAESEDSARQTVSRYLDDVDEAVIRAVEAAVRPAVENVTRQMRKFYGD
jgi:transcriptional regulator with XRE-family HTH domain